MKLEPKDDENPIDPYDGLVKAIDFDLSYYLDECIYRRAIEDESRSE